jgi:iron complex outermembrane recepter protein
MKLTKTFCMTSVSAVALAIGCCAFGTSALAQSDTMETVVVTATGTNISGIAPVGTEAVTLDRDTILSTGQINLTDVVRQLPQVTNLGYFYEGATQGGQNATQATAINLRGLGIGGTLTLVDGHRVPSTGTGTTITDANQLPLAMIQRVEMIVDGNSAIYGSDAIGGVVNYVTRKDFEGIEITGRFTYVDGYNEEGFSITGGHYWDHLGGGFGAGNVIVSYDYDWRDRMWENARARLMQNLTQFGGVDNRVSGGAINGGVGPQTGNFLSPGAPGNIIVASGGTYTYYGIPQGANTHLDWSNLSATPNMIDLGDRTTYLDSMFRHQASIMFNQDLTPWATFYFEGMFTKRHSRGEQDQSSGTTSNVCLPTTSLFYPTNVPAGAVGMCSTGPSIGDHMVPGITVQHDFSMEDPSWGTDNPDENYALIFGFKVKLPGDWAADVSYAYGADHACGICRFNNDVDFGAYQHQVILNNINPLSTEPLTEAQKSTFIGTNIQASHNVMHDFVLKVDGPLFDLPGGTVKAALGVEYRFESEGLMNGANRTQGEQGAYAQVPTYDHEFVWDNITHNTRSVAAAFGEIYVPIVGEANSMPLVRALTFDGAVRFDHYSDFGDTINPKLGLTWKVLDDLQARGSWGTSFRAPTVTDSDPFVASYKFLLPYVTTYVPSSISCWTPRDPITHGCLSYVLILFGSQPGLQPEKSINWSLGFDYKPHWLDGFDFSTTYYNIHYTNRIQNPPFGEFFTSDANFAIYGQYAKAINNPVTCVNGNASTYDPALLPYLAAVGLYTLNMPVAGQECLVQAVEDARTTNIGTTNDEGVDFNISYHFDTSVGLWNIGAMVTVIVNENAKYTANSPVVTRLNTLGYPVAWRGRGSVGWINGPWAANLFMNYVGSYKNTTPLNTTVSTHISDWITFDAGVSYSFGDDVWEGFKDMRLSLNAQNVLDRDPPLVLTSGYASYDPSQANILGRVVTIQFTKSF